MRFWWLGLAAMLGAAALPRPAVSEEYGNEALGRTLAETWCKNCHLIDRDDVHETQSDAPPFAEIAKSIDDARLEQLRIWLTDPHGAMPNLSLSRAEIADLLAYLSSLTPAD